METVYLKVKEAPKDLKPNEMVIKNLDFIAEVKACQRQRGGSAILGPNYLRAVAAEVGRRYDKKFNPFRNVVPNDFSGVAATTDEEIAVVVARMFEATYPQIHDFYVETRIADRPYGVDVIYYAGDRDPTKIFSKRGIRELTDDLIQARESAPVETQPEVVEETIEPVGEEFFQEEVKVAQTEPVLSSSESSELLADLLGETSSSEAEVVELKPLKNKKKNKKGKNTPDQV